MSYIDALYKKDEDKIYVVERDPKKGRIFTEYDARYVFYYEDARGKHRSMTGAPLQRVQCATHKGSDPTSNCTRMTSIPCSGVWKRTTWARRRPN
jgi:hypothetical protein